MTTATQHLLDSFDLLSEADKQIVIGELLQRRRDFDLPPLSAADRVANAAALFLELDRREATEA